MKFFNKLFFSCLFTLTFGAISTSAIAEIVIIVNPSNTATKMLPSQAEPFFLGKSSTFTPIDQNESSPIKAEFYKKVTGKELSQVKALWSKLIFTGKAALPKEYNSDSDVKKAVASDPKAIAYIDKNAVDSSVKVIATLP